MWRALHCRQTCSLFSQELCHCPPPLLGAQRLSLSLVPERHSLSLFMLSGFLIFKVGGGVSLFVISFNYATRRGVHPPGRGCPCGWVSLRVGTTCAHSQHPRGDGWLAVGGHGPPSKSTHRALPVSCLNPRPLFLPVLVWTVKPSEMPWGPFPGQNPLLVPCFPLVFRKT